MYLLVFVYSVFYKLDFKWCKWSHRHGKPVLAIVYICCTFKYYFDSLYCVFISIR